jgi:hypothetical protein
MKTAVANRTIAALLVLASAGPGVLAAQTELLLFRDGRVLVRQSLPIRIPAGRSVQRLSLDQHDPSSLMALDSGLVLLEALYPHTINLASLYQRVLGRRLIFRRQPAGDTVSAVVIGTDPLRFGLPWGVSLTPPGDPLFPADLLGPGRTVEATFETPRPLDRLHLAYVTSGAGWSAEYSLVIHGDGSTVSGTASLHSSALAADSAEITLLDGIVNRTAPFARQQAEDREQYAFGQLAGAAVNVRGAALSVVAEVHLYQIPGRHAMQPGMTSVVELFRPAQAPVERVFAIPGVLPPAGSPMGGGGQQTPPVELRYRVRRTLGNPFGALSLPAGVARLYTESPGGRRILIGEASTSHASAGEDLDLLAGNSLDLVARREDVEAQMAQDSVQRADGGVNIRTVAYLRTYRVTFTNRSDSTETVEVVERRPGGWSVVTSSVAAERLGTDAFRFRVMVPAHGETVLTYRLRIPTN